MTSKHFPDLSDNHHCQLLLCTLPQALESDKVPCQNEQMAKQSIPARTYRGVSREERRESRRRALILAAIRKYGSLGFRQTSVKSICSEAGLTERYFYESFSNSEDLLLAAYHAITTGLLNELTQAVERIDGNRSERVRIMLHAYFSLLKREPAAARIILVEIRGVSQAATQAYTDALHEFSRRLADDFSIGREDAQQLLALGMVGGISLMALHWIEQGYVQSVDVMVDVALRLTLALL